MIDAHTHLNSPTLFQNRKDYILEFEKNWWTAIINAWADIEYNNNGIQISNDYIWDVYVKCTIWLHPYEVVIGNVNEENIEEEIKNLKKIYIKNKKHIVAIWEAGIDTHYNGEIKIELQKKLLKMQCDLAYELNLPIVIHSRDDFDDTIEILKDYKNLKIYFHCRWYGPKEVTILQKEFENIWIGFCGNITYPKAQNIRDSLMVCDIENILIETDAPYLSPQNLRGQTNSPANVKHIYEFISKELNIELNNLNSKVNKNFDELYKE